MIGLAAYLDLVVQTLEELRRNKSQWPLLLQAHARRQLKTLCNILREKKRQL